MRRPMSAPAPVTATRSALAGAALAVLLSIGPGAPAAHAGAWTRDAGSVFFKLGYERWNTSARYDSTGARTSYLTSTGGGDLKRQYRSQALRAYVEYGLSDVLTVAASGGYQWIEAEGLDLLSRTSGFPDLTLQLKRRLIAAPVVVSVNGEGRFPTGYDPLRFPALGSGRTDFGARIAAGASSRLGYVTTEAGYVVRGGNRANEVPMSAEAGLQLPGDFMLRGALAASMTSGHASGGAQFDPALADQRYLSATGGVVLRGRPFDFALDVDRVLSGRNTLAGTRLNFALWYSR